MKNKLRDHSYNIIKDPEYGYFRADPLPTPEKVDRFYKDEFYTKLKKFRESDRSHRVIGKALLLAMLLHGTFNLVCRSGPLWGLGMLVLLPIMWKMSGKKIRQALESLE